MTFKYNTFKKSITIQKMIHLNLHLHFKKKGRRGINFMIKVISLIINSLKYFLIINTKLHKGQFSIPTMEITSYTI